MALRHASPTQAPRKALCKLMQVPRKHHAMHELHELAGILEKIRNEVFSGRRRRRLAMDEWLNGFSSLNYPESQVSLKSEQKYLSRAN